MEPGDLLRWAFIVSVVMFFGSLIVLPILIVRMRADYFSSPHPPLGSLADLPPVLRIVLLVGKNLLGAAVLLAGVVMLLTPGQGLIAVLVGLSLLDIPGKRKFEAALIRRPTILRAINKLRAMFSRPPLVLPDGEETQDPDEVQSNVDGQKPQTDPPATQSNRLA